MVFAVATIDQVLIYTTQSTVPLGVIKHLHYDSINDLAWMSTHVLAVASSDGFISFIRFDPSLIGQRLNSNSDLIPEDFREIVK
jgi:chromatin assembly factor 1 subunit B